MIAPFYPTQIHINLYISSYIYIYMDMNCSMSLLKQHAAVELKRLQFNSDSGEAHHCLHTLTLCLARSVASGVTSETRDHLDGPSFVPVSVQSAENINQRDGVSRSLCTVSAVACSRRRRCSACRLGAFERGHCS